MAYQSIEVRKLTPTIGAEIFGVDLAKPLGNQQFQEVHDALMDNLVIFFRDQKMSDRPAQGFRPPLRPAAHASQRAVKEHPEILVIKADEKSKHVAGEEWHSDVSCDPEPPMGSILYLKEAAARRRRRHAVRQHVPRLRDALRADQGDAAGPDGAARQLQGALLPRQGDRPRRHQVPQRRASGRAHPSGDRHARRSTSTAASRRAFRSSRKNESDALLEMLYRHIETPEFQCRFKWQPNSIAFWDNRCAQHHAMFDYFPHRRYGHRVTVCGDKPFYRAA